MLCQTCKIAYPFYMKYCRNCGRSLSQQNEQPKSTSQLASNDSKAEVGANNGYEKFVTSAITMAMGKPQTTLADFLRQVLDQYPSLNTVKLTPQPETESNKCHNGYRTGDSLRETVRELEFTELVELEKTFELPPTFTKPTATLEFFPKKVVDTKPLKDSPLEAAVEKEKEKDIEKKIDEEIEKALKIVRNCPQGSTRLHIRATERLVRISKKTSPLPEEQTGRLLLRVKKLLVNSWGSVRKNLFLVQNRLFS